MKKSNMWKILAITLSLMIAMTGCGKKTPVVEEPEPSSEITESSIEESSAADPTVEGAEKRAIVFLDAYLNFDEVVLQSISSDEVCSRIGAGDDYSIANVILDLFEYGKTNAAIDYATRQFEKKLEQSTVRSYEITDIDDSEFPVVTITADITHGPGVMDIEKVDMKGITADICANFLAENQDSLAEQFADATKDEIMEYVYETLLPQVFDEVYDEMQNLDFVNYKATLTLEIIDGDWIVTHILEKPVGTTSSE